MLHQNTMKKILVSAYLAIVALVTPLPGAADDDSTPRFTRTEVEVAVPDVTLIDQNGDKVQLRDVVSSDEAVCVDFIFATCTTICPILSAGYSSLQRKLGDDLDRIRLVSISIDPEHDGPAEMRGYLARYRAKPGWDFLTGTRTDIDAVMRAFDAFIPDKMSHRPLIFVRKSADGGWTRINGFPSSAELIEELRLATARSEHEDKG